MASAESFKRRWLQFRLGRLLSVTAIAALVCGWWSDHIRQTRQRQHAETMLMAYRAHYGIGQEEALVPFRNVGIGRGASRLVYASPEEFVEDLRVASDWNAVNRVRSAAESSGVIEAATPKLIQFLESPDADLRERALYLLGVGGTRGKETVAAIGRALAGDASKAVRRRAASALGDFGRDARSAVQQLAAALHDEDSRVRAYAADALWNATKDQRAIDAMLALIDGPTSDGRLAALETLRSVGPKRAARAIPRLVALLDDREQQTRELAMLAVATLAPRETAFEAISNAFPLLSHSDRRMAASLLIKLDGQHAAEKK